MKKQEALDEISRLSSIIRKNAMIRAGATKDNSKKPAVDMIEKYGQFGEDKPRKVLDKRFQERYKSRLMAMFSDDLPEIYRIFSEQDIVARFLTEDPDFKNKRADIINTIQKLITDLVTETPRGLIKRRLPLVNCRCSAINELSGELMPINEALWSAVYYALRAPYTYTDDIFLAFRYFLKYIDSIYRGFIFDDPDPDSDEFFYKSIYYDHDYDRISIITEMAIIFCGGDESVASYLESRRVNRINESLTFEDAANYYAKAANYWTNPLFSAWVKTKPEIKMTPMVETICVNNKDAYQFILAITFLAYILNSNMFNWTLANMIGVRLA